MFLILSAFCFFAAFTQRVCGFGFGIFIMTMLPLIMPSYGEATTLSSLLASVTSSIIVIKLWHHIQWQRLLPILTTFLIVSFFAVQFVARSTDATLNAILGITLIATSLYFFCASEHIQLRPTLPTQVSMGVLSGIMGGLFGMQGPPAVLYFLGATKTKEQYIALAQTYFLIGNLCMTVFRAHHGFLTPAVGYAWCYGLLAVLLGTWVGGKVFNRISARTLRRLVYAYMAVSGMIFLLR